MVDSAEMYGFTKPAFHDSCLLKDAEHRQLTMPCDQATIIAGCGSPPVKLGVLQEGPVA
jgi:hypothetical protein